MTGVPAGAVALCLAVGASLLACPMGAASAERGTVLAAVPSAAPTGPARVELSVDGTTWSHDLVADLFEPDLVWVPGEVATATVYVRTSCSQAQGSADVELDSPALVVRTRVYAGTWTSPPSLFVVDADQIAPLDVEVTYDPQADDSTRLMAEPLSIVVTAACYDATPAPPPSAKVHPTTSPGATSPGATRAGAMTSRATTPFATGAADRPAVAASSGRGLARTGVGVAGTVVVVLALGFVGAWLLSLRTRAGQVGPDA
ncbi:MAG: hypothetical protein FWF02_02210 [Micrococcales bacterium]|nr:hypothetical protein [Micrococcales bacterium]MCL2666505.1 hypothetical protein [Micrococcales bacterium]